MANFLTDGDVATAGNFQEGEVSLAVEYTVPAGTLNGYRWRSGSAAPSVTPLLKTYNAGGTVVSGSQVGLDAAWSGPQLWNAATISGGVALTAGTYRMTVNTTHYCAVSGFFSGGSITRSGVTGVQGRFIGGVAAPTSTSTALYGIDIDFTPSSGTPFTRDYATNWNVFANFTRDYVSTWRVLNSFTRDYASTWRVLNAWTRDYASSWRVLNAWTRDYAASWNVLSTFTKDYATTWNVLTGTGFTRDYSSTWRVLGAFTQDYASAWRVLSIWTRDYVASWMVLNGFTRDYSTTWNVFSTTGFVRDYATSWRVLNAFTEDYVTRWRILSDTPTPPLSADVVATLNDTAWAILTADSVVARL